MADLFAEDSLALRDPTVLSSGADAGIADHHLPDALPCPPEKTLVLADTETRLKRLELVLQE